MSGFYRLNKDYKHFLYYNYNFIRIHVNLITFEIKLFPESVNWDFKSRVFFKNFNQALELIVCKT